MEDDISNQYNDKFPRLTTVEMEARLAPPEGRVRLIVDTDAANEIDDQYAIAWALLSPEKLDVVAVTAEPFSFAHHRPEVMATEAAIDAQNEENAPDEHLVGGFQGWVRRLHAQGRRAADLEFCGTEEGMERSYQEILTVYQKLGMSPDGQVLRGSDRYLSSHDEPLKTHAAEAIVDHAKSGDRPLYIAAMGCVTNIASALLMAPEIVRDIVVIWTSAYPSSSQQCNRPSLNLVQDTLSSRLIFDSGVPHIYLPGYQIGAQLKISLPEMEQFISGKSAIGDYLHHLYTHNPLHHMYAIEGAERRTWVIWDIIDIAWLLNPDWVPTHITQSPILDDDLYWRRDPSRHLMREAHDVQRDEIFLDLYDKLAGAPG